MGVEVVTELRAVHLAGYRSKAVVPAVGEAARRVVYRPDGSVLGHIAYVRTSTGRAGWRPVKDGRQRPVGTDVAAVDGLLRLTRETAQ